MKKLSILVVALMILGLCSCASSSEPEQAAVESSAQVIYKDEYVEVTFEGVSDLPMVEGMTAVNLSFQNLSDQEITVLPLDSSVNDSMVQFVSGTPAIMQGGKKLAYAMSFNNETAGISDYSEVKTLEFSLSVNDADFNEISRSDILSIEVS
jgi:hypothetical protein